MNGKKKTLLCCIFFIIVMMICSPVIISHYSLPNQIQVFVGEEYELDFDIPLKAKLSYEDKLQFKVKNALVDKECKIRLNEPISFKMNEEGRANVTVSIFGGIPLKTVSICSTPHKEVIPCGQIIGVKIETKGILVLGVGNFEVEGKMVAPCKELVQPGDMIQSINGEKVQSKEDLREIIENTHGEPINMLIQRNEDIKEIIITPEYSQGDRVYKVGLWVKDSTQGIGTLTYYDPETRNFGAIGHGITDSETKHIVPIKGGIISKATVSSIKKGEKGAPGELSGVIELDHKMGKIVANTPLGIYGQLNDFGRDIVSIKPIPIAFQNEVHEGKAIILVALPGKKVEPYEVYIQKVSKYSTEPSKGMVIKILDKRLIDVTNGIVQGMSGSPIIQDNKLVGAVTHVFVQDSTRGYGIFIENMINFEKLN